MVSLHKTLPTSKFPWSIFNPSALSKMLLSSPMSKNPVDRQTILNSKNLLTIKLVLPDAQSKMNYLAAVLSADSSPNATATKIAAFPQVSKRDL